MKSNEEEEEKKLTRWYCQSVKTFPPDNSECNEIEEEAIWYIILSCGEKVGFLTEANPKDQEMEIESPKT